MGECQAWLLDFGDNRRAAVGSRELLHLVPSPTLHEIPCTPRHCTRILDWEGKLLPVVDPTRWLADGALAAECILAGIVGFESGPDGEVELGALSLVSPPKRIQVDDEWACPLPEDLAGWRRVVSACFRYDGAEIAILHLESLFAPHADYGQHMASLRTGG